MRSHRALRSVLAVALAIQVASVYSWSAVQAAKLDMKTMRGTVVLDRLRREVAETPGLVLADEYMALLTLEGRPVVYQPYEMKQLAQAGLWDERPFVEEIERRRFDLILCDTRYVSARWTPAQRAAMDANYEEVGRPARRFSSRGPREALADAAGSVGELLARRRRGRARRRGDARAHRCRG